jgi:hypothetical protein
VYNSDTNDLKFIDFGNMKSIGELLVEKQYDFFWNHPLELSIETMPVNRDNVKTTLENNKRFLEYTENKNDPKMAVMILKPGSKAKKPPKILNPELVTKIVEGVVDGSKTMVSTSEKSIITTDTYGLAGSLCYVLNKMFEQGTIDRDKYNTIYEFLKQYFDPNVLTRRGDDIEATIRDYKTLLSSIGLYDGEMTAIASQSKAAASPNASPKAAALPKAAASPRRSSSSGSDKKNKTKRKRSDSKEGAKTKSRKK